MVSTVGTRLALLATAVLLVAPATAAADERGVAVDVGRIDVNETLQPGGDYTLPAIGVRNPGSQPSRYVIGLTPLETEHQAVPEAWVTITPTSLELAPDERQQVEPVLRIPPDAEPGGYETLLAAQVAGEGEGARVGAAAATRLTFTVGDDPVPPDDADAGGVRGGGWLLAGLLAGLLVALARRFKGVRIRIERQT